MFIPRSCYPSATYIYRERGRECQSVTAAPKECNCLAGRCLQKQSWFQSEGDSGWRAGAVDYLSGTFQAVGDLVELKSWTVKSLEPTCKFHNAVELPSPTKSFPSSYRILMWCLFLCCCLVLFFIFSHLVA